MLAGYTDASLDSGAYLDQRKHCEAISFASMKIQNTKEPLQATNANLSRSEFDDVNLQEATFTNVNLSKATFTDINFTGAKFSNLNLTNVEIEACETTGMKFRGVLVSELFDAYKRNA